MPRIDSALFDIGTLDSLADRDSVIHRLDPRAKVVTTLVFVIVVVSFGRYEISALLPFALFPLTLILLADLPAGYLLKKLLLAAPFAVGIGLFNPWFDRQALLQFGSLEISGGWVSFASILLRFSLSVLAALVLIATTGFTGICSALERLGAPRVFSLQLLFLYRYLFVLIDEAKRMTLARSLRSFGGRGLGLKILGPLLGHLLLRTLDRAQRLYRAMLCRGFDGEIRRRQPARVGGPELVFTLGCSAAFIALRLYNVPQRLGQLLLELVR